MYLKLITGGAMGWGLLLFLLAGLVTTPLLRAQDLVRISETEARKMAINKVNPEYPSMAKQMHVSGTVVVDAEVDTEGTVDKVLPISGNVLLNAAVTAALRKWKLAPFLTGGKPARVVVRFSFTFVL